MLQLKEYLIVKTTSDYHVTVNALARIYIEKIYIYRLCTNMYLINSQHDHDCLEWYLVLTENWTFVRSTRGPFP